jgi:hypothetical protein
MDFTFNIAEEYLSPDVYDEKRRRRFGMLKRSLRK